MSVGLEEIAIRNDLRAGDLGYVVYRHGLLYGEEYGYNIEFETYVAAGVRELYERYDPERDRAWICEHGGRMIGFLVLMHRENDAAQLRYFLIEPEYRGIGLGKHLMKLFMAFLRERGYKSAYLVTTHELEAAASLYKRHGFVLTDEEPSSEFGKPVRMQRYELTLA